MDLYTIPLFYCTTAVQCVAPLFTGRGRPITFQGGAGDLHNNLVYVSAPYLEVL